MVLRLRERQWFPLRKRTSNLTVPPLSVQTSNPTTVLLALQNWLWGGNPPTITTISHGGTVATLNVTSTQTTSLLPFTAGAVFPDGTATGSLTMNLPNAQVVIMNTWPSGSARHAICSGHINLTANVPTVVNVTPGTSSGTNLTSANIASALSSAGQNVVNLGVSGSIDLSTLLASPLRTFISGPQMVECHYRTTLNGMLVNFYVRLYLFGRVWIQVSVENGYVDIANSAKSYIATVTIGGTVIFGPTQMNHQANTRWTQEAWIGGDPAVIATQTTTEIETSLLVPNYWNDTPLASSLNALYQVYHPLIENGGTQAFEPGTGDADQIGWMSEWDAFCITSNGDSRAYNSMLANAKAVNSFAIVWRGSSDNNIPCRPSIYPTAGFFGLNSSGGNPPAVTVNIISMTGTLTNGSTTISNLSQNPLLLNINQSWAVNIGAFSGGTLTGLSATSVNMTNSWTGVNGPTTVTFSLTLTWDLAHHGSEGFLSYMMTGRYFDLETMQMQTSCCYLFHNASQNGMGVNRLMTSQTRAMAWCVRDVTQYLSIAPSDLFYTDYATLMANNATHWANLITTTANFNQLGVFYNYEITTAPNGQYGPGILSPLEQIFLLQSYGMAVGMKPLTTMTNIVTIANYNYQFVVGLLGDPAGAGTTTYDFEYSTPYNAVFSPITSGTPVDFTVGPNSFFGNFGQVYHATAILNSFGAIDNTLQGSSGSDPSIPIGYWSSQSGPISLAVDQGAPGATGSYLRMSGANNYSVLRNSGYNAFPKYGVRPRVIPTADQMQALLNSMAAGTWAAIPNSAINPALYGNDTTNSFSLPSLGRDYSLALANAIHINQGPSAVIDAWSGATYDTSRKRLVISGGGHQAYSGNEIYVFDFPTLKWIRLTTPSDPTNANCLSVFAPDGNPWPSHTYETINYRPATDSMIVIGISGTWAGPCTGVGPGPQTNHVESFNFATNTWSALPNDWPGGNPSPGFVSAFDPSNGCIYGMGFDHFNGAPSRLNPDNSWTKFGAASSSDYHQSGAIKPGVMLVSMSASAGSPDGNGNGTGPGLNVLNLANGAITILSPPTITGDLTAMSYVGFAGQSNGHQSANGLVYYPPTGEFVSWNPGTQPLYRLTPGNADGTGTWNWTANAMGGATPPSEAGDANNTGLYKRWNYLPGYNCFIAMPLYNGNIYVAKPNF